MGTVTQIRDLDGGLYEQKETETAGENPGRAFGNRGFLEGRVRQQAGVFRRGVGAVFSRNVRKERADAEHGIADDHVLGEAAGEKDSLPGLLFERRNGMYLDKAVMIPKRKGISYKSKGDTNYVIYEIGRKYDPEKQYTVPERVQIGIQIPAEPEMMLPNENYLKHFYSELGKPDEEEGDSTGEYETERRKKHILRELFLSTFHEIQNLSRREPDEVVNEEKVERLNQLLEPLKEMLQDEEYAELLEVIPLPEVTDGKEKMKGLTYSDVAIILNHYKNLMNRYFRKKF